MQKMTNSGFRRFVATLLIAALAGCTTAKSYTDATLNTVMEDLRPGDRIMVYTHAGRVYDIAVEEVTYDSILANNRSIDKQDIARIDRKQLSAVKTAAVVVGSALATVVVAFVAVVIWDITTPDD